MRGTVAGHVVGAQWTFVDTMDGWGRFQSLGGWKAEGRPSGGRDSRSTERKKAFGPEAGESLVIHISLPPSRFYSFIHSPLPLSLWFLQDVPLSTYCHLTSLISSPLPHQGLDHLLLYSHISSLGTTWVFIQNADSRAPPQTSRIKICILTISPGDSRAHCRLRSTGPEYSFTTVPPTQLGDSPLLVPFF